MLNIRYFLIASFVFSILSCKQELELYNSKTIGFSGRFFVRSMKANGDVLIKQDDTNEIQIYNTSADKVGEVWIDDHSDHYVAMRQKFYLTGSPEKFSSRSLAFGDLPDNVKSTDVNSFAKPVGGGLEDEYNYDVIRAAVVEGAIFKKGVKVTHLNKEEVADSLQLTLQLYGGTVKYKSVEKPKNLWVSGDTPEYIWQVSEVVRDPLLDEVIILQGHRVTGFE